MLSILEKVRAKVQDGYWRGHIAGKGMEGWYEGPGCLIQLLAQAKDDNYEATACLNEVLYERGWNSTAEFNDCPGRTPEEVLQVIDEAIARAINA